MSGQQLYPESFSPNIFFPGQVQAFTFNRPLSQWQWRNDFAPTSLTNCDSLFELINLNDAGYRFHQSTSNTAQRGDFILEQFNNGTIPGTPLFTIQESTGDFVFSPQSGGAIQINNGNSVTPLQFYNSAGTHYVAFQAGNLSSNIAWTLPTTDSTGTQGMVSNGSGSLSWETIPNNTATYIIQTADASLPNAQVLASLSTGIVKNTTATGVLTIAAAGIDYYAPGYPTYLIDDFNLNGSPDNSYGNLGVGTQAFNSLILNSSSNTSNLSVGTQAGYSFTTGYDNTMVGQYAAFSFISGSDNTFIGLGAGLYMTSGNQNTIVGSNALPNVTSGSSRNSVLGYNAAQNQTIYNYCCFFGANADASVNNLTNAIAIGNSASVGASNSLVLGNNVNVGIGTSTPAYLLDVNGEINGIWNGSIIGLPYGGTNANLTASNGGIVYSTASALSVLAGTVTARQALLSGSSTAPTWSTATYPSTTTINQLLYSSANNVISGLATANNSVLLTNGSGVPAWATLTSSVVTSISGTANQITASASTGAVTLSLPSSVIITTSLTAGNLELTGNILQSNNTNGSISIAPNGSGNILMLPSGSTGFVGINQASPHSPLHFANSVNNRIITLFEITNNAYQYYGFGIQSSTLVYNVPATTAIHAFYAGTSSTTSQELMRITATGTTGNSGCIGINVGATPSAGCHVIGGVQNVSGEDTCFRAQSSSNSAKIELDCTNGSGRLYEIRSTNTGTLDIVDRTGSAEKFIINTSGVGFGASAAAPSYDGDCNGTFRSKRHLGNANAPTVVLGGTGVVGTGATSSITGSEVGGIFTLNTGTGVLGAGTVGTFTLASAMPSSTFSIVLFPATTAISTAVYATATSSSAFTLSVNATSGLLGLSASTTYKWNYHITGY